MKRTPLRRARRKPAAVIQADIWREGLGPCAVCKALRVRLNDHVDGHHVIPAQTLRRHGLHDYLVDKRNRLPVCRSHHESHHSRVIPITRVMLPAAVFEFAAEVGLGWWLDKHYPDPDAAPLLTLVPRPTVFGCVPDESAGLRAIVNRDPGDEAA